MASALEGKKRQQETRVPAPEVALGLRASDPASTHSPGYSLARLSRSALPTTLTDDSAMAAAATAGDKSQPVNGYSRPAAKGTPAAL